MYKRVGFFTLSLCNAMPVHDCRNYTSKIFLELSHSFEFPKDNWRTCSPMMMLSLYISDDIRTPSADARLLSAFLNSTSKLAQFPRCSIAAPSLLTSSKRDASLPIDWGLGASWGSHVSFSADNTDVFREESTCDSEWSSQDPERFISKSESLLSTLWLFLLGGNVRYGQKKFQNGQHNLCKHAYGTW